MQAIELGANVLGLAAGGVPLLMTYLPRYVDRERSQAHRPVRLPSDRVSAVVVVCVVVAASLSLVSGQPNGLVTGLALGLVTAERTRRIRAEARNPAERHPPPVPEIRP